MHLRRYGNYMKSGRIPDPLSGNSPDRLRGLRLAPSYPWPYNRTMNLIFITSEPDSQNYGADKSLFRLCERLSENGHKITLLYLKEGDFVERYRGFCAH